MGHYVQQAATWLPRSSPHPDTILPEICWGQTTQTKLQMQKGQEKKHQKKLFFVWCNGWGQVAEQKLQPTVCVSQTDWTDPEAKKVNGSEAGKLSGHLYIYTSQGDLRVVTCSITTTYPFKSKMCKHRAGQYIHIILISWYETTTWF